MQSSPRQKYGFSLIELVVSIGIIGILVMISVPVLNRYVQRNDLSVARDVFVQDLYRAQSLARNGETGNNWGVYAQAGSITVFQGSSYAQRNQNYDEVFSTSSNIGVTGTNQYVFASFTGLPSAAGSTTLQKNSDTELVSVSSKGVINY